ncbi:MAG: sugar phosphate isomerase/epimerase [Coriobacteriales bacterium]|jgi:sugar phosphate isomerase/epimerase|nr:sugar phosphate isomerase/epimerase [Coriobacteriales bacterium]
MGFEANARSRWYLSTIAADAAPVALAYGLGIEITEFCMATNLDVDYDPWGIAARTKAEGIKHLTFHAPFAELCPAAVDPLVLEVTRRRYIQSYEMARSFGTSRMIVHTGYIPNIYDYSYFVEHSAMFWRSLLAELGDGCELLLENVFDETPDLFVNIVREVADPRLRICLDVGHANLKASMKPVEEWVALAAPYLAHLHVHNNFGNEDAHYLPGIGSIDMPKIVSMAMGLCPDMTVTFECRDAQGAVDWLLAQGF